MRGSKGCWIRHATSKIKIQALALKGVYLVSEASLVYGAGAGSKFVLTLSCVGLESSPNFSCCWKRQRCTLSL